VFDQGPNPVNVMTIMESDVWHLPTETFQTALSRSPRLMQAVIHTLCRRTRHLYKWWKNPPSTGSPVAWPG